VTLDFPLPLQQRVINALKADPKSVDLRAQAPHFYALGARIMDLFEDRAVLDTLLNVSESDSTDPTWRFWDSGDNRALVLDISKKGDRDCRPGAQSTRSAG
jgi:hypothetical protein